MPVTPASTWEAGKSRTAWATQRPSHKITHNGNNANYSNYSCLYPLFSLIHEPNDHTVPHKHVQFREIITKVGEMAHLWFFVCLFVLSECRSEVNTESQLNVLSIFLFLRQDLSQNLEPAILATLAGPECLSLSYLNPPPLGLDTYGVMPRFHVNTGS